MFGDKVASSNPDWKMFFNCFESIRNKADKVSIGNTSVTEYK